MTQNDKKLLEAARRLRWEDIDETKAETQEGRDALHALAVRKFHLDEARCGLI